MVADEKVVMTTLVTSNARKVLLSDIAESRRKVAWLGLVASAAWLTTYLGKDVVALVASLYPNAIQGQPYFQFANADLLYVWMPFVILNSFVLLVVPGVFLVMGIGRFEDWSDVLPRGFGASFVFWFVVLSAVKAVVGTPLNRAVFLATVGTGGLLAWLFLAARVFRGKAFCWPRLDRRELRRLLWMLFIPFIGLVSLLPVVFWQDMHDDGLEALEIGRSLSTTFLPRFPNASGFMGFGIGMIAMAYPAHWLVTLFGPLEASARLPLFLYLPLLFCLLVQLIEWRSPRRLGFGEEAVLCVALGIYTVTMSYNASYDPYFADVAAPAALETMTIVCMLAMFYFLWNGQNIWFYFFALMAYLCRPTGLLVLGLLGFGIILCIHERRRSMLVWISAAIGSCLLLTLFYEKIYLPSIIESKDFGYPVESIMSRFLYLKLDDLSRINYALFPSGILPLISLFAFRWQDPWARVLTIVSVAYFACFYFPAFIALHHFVPVMIVPLVVFWRLYLHAASWFRRVSLPAAALAAMAAFWLSLPRHFEINRTIRAIGQKTALLVGNYHTDYRAYVEHAKLISELARPDWEVEDPARELVSGFASITYYSAQPKPPGAPINYIVQPLRNQAPLGYSKIADDKVAALYIRDLEEWHRDRFRTLQTNYRSSLYDIPRTTLFRHWGIPQGQYSVDLGSQPFIRRLRVAFRKKK